MRRRDGQQLVILENARPMRDGSGRIVGYEGTIANITERKRAEQAIFAEKERAQVTLQSIGDAVISTDAEGRIEYINPVAESLTAWSLAEARGQPIGEVLRLVNELTREPMENSLSGALGRTGSRRRRPITPCSSPAPAHEVAIQESAAPICDRSGRVIGAVIVFHDVTKERRLKRALSYQASHDALTGLINRREFDNRLHAALLSAQRGEGAYALLYIDLDQFKVVNDTCGHQAGDRLLRDVTGLLQTRVRASDTIARLGGDEFGVLLEGCTLEQATRIAEGVRQAIRDFRFVVGRQHAVGGREHRHGADPRRDRERRQRHERGRHRLLRRQGRRPQPHPRLRGGRRLAPPPRDALGGARHARRRGQPPRAVLPAHRAARGGGTGRGFHELTVRLREDSGALVPPGEFIPAAERYNVMSVLDRWVVGQAIELLRERQRRGQPLPLVAVNLSGTSLNEQSFVEFVLQSVTDPGHRRRAVLRDHRDRRRHQSLERALSS